jgi:signal peptidase II
MHGKEKTAAAFIAAVLFLLDQAAKYFLDDSVWAYCNPNGPWGIEVDNAALIVVMTGILFFVGYGFWIRDERVEVLFALSGKIPRSDMPYRLALSLIFSGGASNLVDRVMFGCVRDVSVVSWLPAFNLGDALLSIGSVVFLAWLFRGIMGGSE